MTRISTRKATTFALLTSAVFTISSLTPVDIAPGPFSPDAAFAKSENANGGNKGGNSGNKGGNKGGGKGGEKSSAKSNNGGGKGGGKGLTKGVGGMFANVGKKGGNLINGVFGRDKAKAKKTANTASIQSAHHNGKVKAKDVLASYGLHPSDMKGGWMGVMNANPNGNFNSSINSVHGRARTWMEQAAVAGYLDDVAAEAAAAVEQANAMIDALNALADYEAAVATLDPTLEADAMEAAMAPLDTDLQAVLTETGLSLGEVEAAMVDGETAAAAAERLAGEIGTLETAAAEAELAALDAQAASEELFNDVTKGKTLYDTPVENGAVGEEAVGGMVLGDVVYDYLVEKDDRWQTLVDDAVAEAEAELAAEAEAAAAEGEVVLLDGNGEPFTLAVE